MMLNMITTGAMTRLGYVYENLMVNVHMQNSIPRVCHLLDGPARWHGHRIRGPGLGTIRFSSR